MTQYRSHTEETIGYMKEYFDEFLRSKDVFTRYRLSKSGKKTADEYRKERAEYYRCTYVQLIQLLGEPIGMSSTYLIRRRGSNAEFKDLVLKARKAYIENPDAVFWSVRLLLYVDGFWVPSNSLLGLSGQLQSWQSSTSAIKASMSVMECGSSRAVLHMGGVYSGVDLPFACSIAWAWVFFGGLLHSDRLRTTKGGTFVLGTP
ncbi:hypothetical protein FPQ18DRAFT_300871 [Pyronema domesticum]|nr:hypothetical protein FPQ18DRAFT_300871 [Pyronema domesticum]